MNTWDPPGDAEEGKHSKKRMRERYAKRGRSTDSREVKGKLRMRNNSVDSLL